MVGAEVGALNGVHAIGDSVAVIGGVGSVVDGDGVGGAAYGDQVGGPLILCRRVLRRLGLVSLLLADSQITSPARVEMLRKKYTRTELKRAVLFKSLKL